MKMIQTDWMQQRIDMLEIKSVEMHKYVERLNAIDPVRGEGRGEFTAPEIANVLNPLHPDTKLVYALIEAGELGYSDFSTGSKRRAVVSRESIYAFLKRRCKDAGQL